MGNDSEKYGEIDNDSENRSNGKVSERSYKAGKFHKVGKYSERDQEMGKDYE